MSLSVAYGKRINHLTIANGSDEPKMLVCPYGEKIKIKNPFWDATPLLNRKLDQSAIKQECVVNTMRIGYIKDSTRLDALMKVVRPELAAVLNSSKHATYSQAVLFADLYVWYIVADDLLESLQYNCTNRELFFEYEKLLSKICFEGFGFEIGVSGRARDSDFPKTPEQTERIQCVIDGIKDILKRAATACFNNLQFLDLCNVIEQYIGTNAFESLQRTQQDSCLKYDKDLKRYGQMRGYSIGQGMSIELALILQGIYVPRHLRKTSIFQEAWNASLEFIWKANDLIGCAKDAKKNNPINSVNLIRKQRGLSQDEARRVYNKEVFEPAAARLRHAFDPRTLASRMKKELIANKHDQQIISNALKCLWHINWASFKWNMTVARYVP